MSIWGAACFLMGHDWVYPGEKNRWGVLIGKEGARICYECDKIEALPKGFR